mgnify:FL=1
MSEEGAIPIIVGRDKDTILSAVNKYRERNYQVGYAFAELTDPRQCERAVKKIIDDFEKIDGLVNNAGVNDGVGLEKGTYEDFLNSINKNVAHYYKMAQLVLPELKKNKGAIVNIGSKVSVTGQGGTSGYAAACGGRNTLTREWAVELIPYSIRVNSVIVAECYTPLYKKWIESFEDPKAKLVSITNKIPLDKRMTTIEEIANTVAFLISEKSSHTTGQLIYVDGGYTHLDRAIF